MIGIDSAVVAVIIIALVFGFDFLSFFFSYRREWSGGFNGGVWSHWKWAEETTNSIRWFFYFILFFQGINLVSEIKTQERNKKEKKIKAGETTRSDRSSYKKCLIPKSWNNNQAKGCYRFKRVASTRNRSERENVKECSSRSWTMGSGQR